MKPMNRGGRVRTAGRQGGFTLVEILAAMSLAVLVMLGVAQVFKIASDAVTEAESWSSGYGLGRSTFSMLERDLRCFTNEGYFAIISADVPASLVFGGTTRYAAQNPTNPDKYRFDALMFTVVGRTEDMEGNTGTGAATTVGTAAEIVYTFAGRQGSSGGTVLPYEVISTGDDDPRTMILVRKVFPVKGNPSLTGYGSSLQWYNPSSKANGALALMSVDRWNDMGISKFRVSVPLTAMAGNNATSQPKVTTTATWSGGFPTYDSTVNTVVCERISEFYVEALVGASGAESWQRPALTGRSAGLWCGNLRAATTSYAPFKETYLPRLIRVTAVVHPANDQRPLRQESYAGDIPSGYPRKYRGMVFRQVFSLNGRLSMD